jgi:hypothetical protein
MTELHDLLDRATDQVGTPALIGRALTTARRRRLVRRGAVASVVAGLAVLGVVVVPRALDSTQPVREPINTPSPTPNPSPSTGQGAVAPPIDESVVQQAWDPSTVTDLPYYVIGQLPTVLAPVGGASSTPGDTDGVLALSRSDTGRLAVLYGDRGWYGLEPVPDVGGIWDSSLSRDGTRMAVVGEGGLFWCPAAAECPEWTRVDVPERVLGEDARITWTPDAGRLIVAGANTGYLVDLDNGTTTELPYLGGYATFDVASDGRVISGSLEPRAVLEWDGTRQLSSTASGELGGLNDFAIYEDAIAATRIDLTYGNPPAVDDGDGLIVLDRDGLATRSFLPVTGEPGEWVDGEEIKPVQWINKVTVLFSVLVGDVRYLVTWDIRTGAMGRVTSYPAAFDVSVSDLFPA